MFCGRKQYQDLEETQTRTLYLREQTSAAVTSSSHRAAGPLGDISPQRDQICSFLKGCLTRNRILRTSPDPPRKSATPRRGCNVFRLPRERRGNAAASRRCRCCLLLEVMCSIFCGGSGSRLHPDGSVNHLPAYLKRQPSKWKQAASDRRCWRRR